MTVALNLRRNTVCPQRRQIDERIGAGVWVAAGFDEPDGLPVDLPEMPCLFEPAMSAMKYNYVAVATKFFGLLALAPASRSAKRFVPEIVPSLRHSSKPCAASFPAK